MNNKFIFSLYLLAFFSVCTSCSKENDGNDEDPVDPENPQEIIDDYNYVALRNDGQLFAIGNNTGKVSSDGEIPGIEFNTFFNSVTSSSTKIYIYEHRFDPPQGILHVMDKTSGETESKVLDFPEAIFGASAALVSLDWDNLGENLVGVVSENIEQPGNGSKLKVVYVDPETYLVEDQEIDLDQNDYSLIFASTFTQGKLYASASKDRDFSTSDFLEIDLSTKTFSALSLSGNETTIYNLGNTGNSNVLFGFELIPGTEFAANTTAVSVNTQNETVNKLSGIPRISSVGSTQKTFYDKNENVFVQFVFTDDAMNLLKYNPDNGDLSLMEINNPENLSSLIAIIATEELP